MTTLNSIKNRSKRVCKIYIFIRFFLPTQKYKSTKFNVSKLKANIKTKPFRKHKGKHILHKGYKHL